MERHEVNEREHRERIAAWNGIATAAPPERCFDLGFGEVFQRREEGWFLCLHGKAQRPATVYEAALLTKLLG